MVSLQGRTERWRSQRHGSAVQWLFATAVVLAVSVAVSDCGGGVGGSTSGSASSKAVSTTAAASTSNDATTAAVLRAYRAGWAAFEHALADANAEDPMLSAALVNPELQDVRANLLADQRQGIVGRGTFTLHPKVTSLSAASATVVDCAYSTAELIFEATGKAVPPVTPPESDGVSTTLMLLGGAWKVSNQTVTDGKCAPGS